MPSCAGTSAAVSAAFLLSTAADALLSDTHSLTAAIVAFDAPTLVKHLTVGVLYYHTFLGTSP